MKKKFCAMVCVLVLFFALIPTALTNARAMEEKVYFMGVNDTVLDLTADTMPRMVGDSLYVPYTMFDPNYTTGANLGLFSSYSRTAGTVIIYSRSEVLVFDLNNDNSTLRGIVHRDKAIIRNSMVFVPVDAVCRSFDLTWSLLEVKYGHIVRVKSSEAVLGDAEFTDAAHFSVSARYNSYIQSKAPVEEPNVSLDDSPIPTQEVGEETPEANGARLYLAFIMESGEGFTSLLEQLNHYGVYGIFFCRPEELGFRDDDIRSLLAAGHRMGLLLDKDSLAGQLAQAEEGQLLLSHIARTETSLCLSHNLSDNDRDLLKDRLYLWETTLDATSAGRSISRQTETVNGTIRRNRRYFVTMDDSAQSAQALGHILSTLTEDGCEFCLATEITLT